MALESGKYYSQSGAVYLCTRDTVNPVYSDLANLVGLYVEKVAFAISSSVDSVGRNIDIMIDRSITENNHIFEESIE